MTLYIHPKIRWLDSEGELFFDNSGTMAIGDRCCMTYKSHGEGTVATFAVLCK